MHLFSLVFLYNNIVLLGAVPPYDTAASSRTFTAFTVMPRTTKLREEKQIEVESMTQGHRTVLHCSNSNG